MLFRTFIILLPLIVQEQTSVYGKPLNHSLTQIHCTDSPNWIDPIFNRPDCDHALNQFLATSVVEHETTPFEFLAPGTHPSHTLPNVKTPLKVTVGTCTLVIAMLASFAPGMLPAAGRGPWPPTDIASFRDIYFTALAVDVQCTRLQGKAGWLHTGGRRAVGVFFWGTESRMDMVVRNGVHLLRPHGNTTADDFAALR